jgi:hypothetical protein
MCSFATVWRHVKSRHGSRDNVAVLQHQTFRACNVSRFQSRPPRRACTSSALSATSLRHVS